MHRPQPHLYLVSMELCKRGEDILWNLSPIAVRLSNQLAPLKYSSTTPGNYFTGNTLITKALTHLLAWSGAEQIPNSTPAPEMGDIPTAAIKDRCPVPGSSHQPTQRGCILHTHQRKSRRVLHRLHALRSVCRQPSGTAHFSLNEL